MAEDPKVRELIQGVIDEVNEKFARVEQVKKIRILDHDLTQPDRRTDADAEGQAQRRAREVRGHLRGMYEG